MSLVTSAILMVSPPRDEGEDIPEWLTKPLVFETSNRFDQRFKPLDDSAAGGYKYMEVDVYASAFNYVDPSILTRWLDSAVPEGTHVVLVWEYCDGFGTHIKEK